MNRVTTAAAGDVSVAFTESSVQMASGQGLHTGLSVGQLLSVVRAHWKLMATITLTLMMLSAVLIKLLPKTYTATVTLIVDSDVKDPLAGRDFPAEMITSYVSTQMEILTSPIVLQPVVDRLNLTQDKEFAAGFKGNSDALRQFVQRNLAAATQVERGLGGQLIYVSVSAKNAVKAASIANMMADVYLEQDQRRLNEPANERAQRYTQELAELRQKATVAQDKLTAFEKEHNIADMNSATIEVQALETLQQRLLDTQNLRRSLEAKQSEPQSPPDPGATADSVQVLKRLLETQQSQLAQLSSTYGPRHPKVRELNAQIAVTRQSLAKETQGIADDTDSELVRTKELEQKYQRAVADQEAKVLSLRQAQDEGSKLVLELDSAKSVYKQALDGFDQIMFQAVANHSNVTIVSRAVAPLRASKPNKWKLLFLACIAAFGIGVGGPLAYGLTLGRRVRCRDDVERDFGIAVLAQLNAVPKLLEAT